MCFFFQVFLLQKLRLRILSLLVCLLRGVLGADCTVFDTLFISAYNLFYTALPVLALGSFDQDVNEDYSLRFPKLYTPGLENRWFNKKIFVRSAGHGVLTSGVLFFVVYGECCRIE
ncbi:hypothetical protein HAZT_HAZT007978, partial [Hyalella azteca]